MRLERFVLPEGITGEVRVVDEGAPRPVLSGAERPAVAVVSDYPRHRRWGFLPHVAESLARAGFLAVTFDGPGVPGSGADPAEASRRFPDETLDDLKSSVAAVVTGIFERILPLPERVDTRRIGLLGHGIGGTVALRVAAEDSRVGALALWGPSASPAALFRDARAAWRLEADGGRGRPVAKGSRFLRTLDEWSETRVLSAAARIAAPMAVLHGERDEEIPAADATRIAGAARKAQAQTLVLPGTGHSFGVHDPFIGTTEALNGVLLNTIVFFRKSLCPDRPADQGM